MNKTLFSAATLYADGLSPEEIADLAAWATANKEDVMTIADYINPADNGTN